VTLIETILPSRAACDLRDIVRADPFEPEPVDDGGALRWPDGTVFSAERLRDLYLDLPPADTPMAVSQFVKSSDDGSDVAWELHEGTPVPRTGGTLGHSWTMTQLLCKLEKELERAGRWMTLVNTWMAGAPESRDCRIAEGSRETTANPGGRGKVADKDPHAGGQWQLPTCHPSPVGPPPPHRHKAKGRAGVDFALIPGLWELSINLV
jgi:hypothetical protein